MQFEDTSIASLVEYGQQLLACYSDSARLDTQILLCFVLNKELSYLMTWPEKKLDNNALEQFSALLSRRERGEPIAYIVGCKEFWSLPFKVSPATLIPRPDTETLVELVLDLFHHKKQLKCLDLGTGTGAIALALASEMPSWQIEALDYSEDAVALAKYNAKQLGLNQVDIYQSDWFSNVACGSKFDVIVSNPPYIDALDENLAQGDVRYEPKSALVAEQQGLADIKHIAKAATKFLADQGKIFFEHGYQQGQAVRDILLALGYQDAQTVTDLNEHDRISWAVFSNN